MKNFTKMFLAACLLTVFAFSVHAQSVGINADGSAPNGSAMLDVSSTTKGFLAPMFDDSAKSSHYKSCNRFANLPDRRHFRILLLHRFCLDLSGNR